MLDAVVEAVPSASGSSDDEPPRGSLLLRAHPRKRRCTEEGCGEFETAVELVARGFVSAIFDADTEEGEEGGHGFFGGAENGGFRMALVFYTRRHFLRFASFSIMLGQ